MSLLFAAKAASTVGGKVLGFLSAKEKAKMSEEMSRHRKFMGGISADLQRNQVALQETDVRGADRRANQQIQTIAIKDQAAAEVSAAASGTTGGSAESVMRGLKRSALNAQFARIENTDNVYKGIDQERKNIDMAEIFQTDNSVVPKPSFGALLLGLGTAAVDLYREQKGP